MDGENKNISDLIETIRFFFFYRTALHWAAKRNHRQVVGYLLENGADRDIQAHDQSTPAYVCTDDLLRKILQSTISDGKILFKSRKKNALYLI
jgi:ankyrin repeat protein